MNNCFPNSSFKTFNCLDGGGCVICRAADKTLKPSGQTENTEITMQTENGLDSEKQQLQVPEGDSSVTGETCAESVTEALNRGVRLLDFSNNVIVISAGICYNLPCY